MRIFDLFHETGAGASTLARRILWDLREQYVCLILRENYCFAEETASYLIKLYNKFNCPILLLVDEDLPQYHTGQLISEVTAETVPFIVFRVTRVAVILPCMSSTTSSYLTLHLSENESKLAKRKYERYLTGNVKQRAKDFYKAQTFRMVEKAVVAPVDHWQHCQIDRHNKNCHSERGIIKEQLEGKMIKIVWSDDKVEECPIDVVDVVDYKDSMQSFVYYGIFYLLDDYRDRINKHIRLKLDRVSQDVDSREKFEFLAFASLLFAHKACYSLPEICFATRKTVKFDIRDNIPEEAYEFVLVNLRGHFRIVHPIVAEQILHVFCKNCALSRLVINFLEKFIPDAGSANGKLKQAISILLWRRAYRHVSNDGESKKRKKEDFSHLISNLPNDDAEKVLLKGTHVFDDCHSFGHLARFNARELKQFDKAKKFMDKAYKRATNSASKKVICTMYGDIYRYELFHLFSNLEGNVSNDIWVNGDALHEKAVEMYRKYSYPLTGQNLQLPLYGELKLRVEYLKHIRKLKFPGRSNDDTFTQYLLTNKAVLNSDVTCLDLLLSLETSGLHDDNTSNIDIDAVELLELQQALFLLMAEQTRDVCIAATEKLLKKSGSDVNLPAVRRKFVVLHLIDKEVQELTEPKRIEILELLEKNLHEEGCRIYTLKDWLKFARTLPLPYSDVHKALSVLQKCNKLGALVQFYLYVFNFLATLDCEPSNRKQFADYKEAYLNAQSSCQQQYSKDREKYIIKEWLVNGTGMKSLTMKEPEFDCLKVYDGKIGNIEKRYKGAGNCESNITFKGIKIQPFNSNKLKLSNAIVGMKVKFSIGFTFSGIRAINLTVIADSQMKVIHSEQVSTTDIHITPNDHFPATSSFQSFAVNKDQNMRSKHHGKEHFLCIYGVDVIAIQIYC